MGKKDPGFDFLNSSDAGFIRDDEDGDSYRYSDGSGYYHGADGSEGYIYSDGSGYYHGADGSDGYIYSDGSAYYHGADGSDGYKYSDGSGYFHGADGSDGYRYSDGSGYYNSADGDSASFDYYDDADDDDDDSEDDSDISAGAAIVGGLLGVGLAAYAANKQKREEERLEEERRIAEQERIREEKAARRKEKRKAFYKRHWKGLLVFLVILGLAAFGGYKYWEFQKGIVVGLSSDQEIGKDYEQVIKDFENAGFTNVHTNEIRDLTIDEIEDENKVTEVSIRGDAAFKANDKYPYDSRVVITYHIVQSISVPVSSKDGKKMNYEELAAVLEEAGFVNIQITADADLITGWVTKDGSIEEFTINGDKKFSEGDSYRPDADIVIIYHTFK